MGIKKAKASARRPASLADALFSKTQQRVLGVLFGQPDRSFYATELIALAGGGSGAVQRELAMLEQSGLVRVSRLGARKHYEANPESPLFAELCGIARKTLGPDLPDRAGSTYAKNDSSFLAMPRAAEPSAPSYAPQSTSASPDPVRGQIEAKMRANPRVARALKRLGISSADIARFCRKHGIRRLSFFGSVMRDDFRADSDADVLLEFEPGRKPDLFDIVDLKDEFVRLFHGRPVDLMTNPHIRNPFRRESIQRDLTPAYVA